MSVSLEPDRAEFDTIVRDELKRRLGREPSPEQYQAVESLADRLRGQFRPLFGLLTAAALAETEFVPGYRWSPELLVESILKSQMRQWAVASITDEHLDLLYEATLTQGACAEDPEFRARVDALAPAALTALATLSEPGARLGPIVPDLLGEFFLLMRLRGEATTSTRQTGINTRIANDILERSWRYEPAAVYAGRLLEDYLAWPPRTGLNPAVDIMRQAMAALESGRNSFGLQYCCFAAAWKKPEDRDWSEWLRELPNDAKSGVAVNLSYGFYNATVERPEPAELRVLAGLIETLHTEYVEEPAIREALARALANAAAGEPDPAQRRVLTERIETLHAKHGQEPAVREQLARALYNATVSEPDPEQCRALADRIEMLHTEYRQEPAIREALSRALLNATVGELDSAQRRILAERIETLHTRHGQEPAVREQLARALYNATVSEPDPEQCRALADRIEMLHIEYGQEPAILELLAKALFNAMVVEPDPAQRRALADRIETLHSEHGQEPAVREALAKALYNAALVEPDLRQIAKIVDRLAGLDNQHPGEPILVEALARLKARTEKRSP